MKVGEFLEIRDWLKWSSPTRTHLAASCVYSVNTLSPHGPEGGGPAVELTGGHLDNWSPLGSGCCPKGRGMFEAGAYSWCILDGRTPEDITLVFKGRYWWDHIFWNGAWLVARRDPISGHDNWPEVVLNAEYTWLPILLKFSSLCQCCFHLSAVLPVRQLKALCLISVSFEEPVGRLTKKKKKILPSS